MAPPRQGFAFTTWVRRTGAETLLVEQLLCQTMWARPTMNVQDWWIPTETLLAIRRWVAKLEMPLWQAGSGLTQSKRKLVELPCRKEQTYSPAVPLPKEKALAKERQMSQLDFWFKAQEAKWRNNETRPDSVTLLYVEEDSENESGDTTEVDDVAPPVSHGTRKGRARGGSPACTVSLEPLPEISAAATQGPALIPKPRILLVANSVPVGEHVPVVTLQA
jgi:hypothetical protein